MKKLTLALMLLAAPVFGQRSISTSTNGMPGPLGSWGRQSGPTNLVWTGFHESQAVHTNKARWEFEGPVRGTAGWTNSAHIRSTGWLENNISTNIGHGQFSSTVGIVGVLSLSAAVSFPDGVRQTFNPNGTAAGINVGSHAGDPGSPVNGDIWYNSVANEIRARINGTNTSWGSGGGGVGVSDGDKGDITVASSGAAWSIDNNSVSGAKIAFGSDAHGDIPYYNGSDYARLGAGTAGQFFMTQGVGSPPVWTDLPSSATAISTNRGNGFLTSLVNSTNFGRSTHHGSIARTATNLTHGTHNEFVLDGPSFGRMSMTTDMIVGIVPPSSATAVGMVGTLRVLSTGGQITFSNVTGRSAIGLNVGTNLFYVNWDGTNCWVDAGQLPTTGSGDHYMLSNAPAALNPTFSGIVAAPATNTTTIGSSTVPWSNVFSGKLTIFQGGTAHLAPATGQFSLINSNNILYVLKADGSMVNVEVDTGGTTALNDIGDAAADGSVAMAGSRMVYTSSLNGGAVNTFSNTVADVTSDTFLLDLSHRDNADANAGFLRFTHNNGSSVAGLITSTLVQFNVGQTNSSTLQVAGAVGFGSTLDVAGAQTNVSTLGVGINLTVAGFTTVGSNILAAVSNVVSAGSATSTLSNVFAGRVTFPTVGTQGAPAAGYITQINSNNTLYALKSDGTLVNLELGGVGSVNVQEEDGSPSVSSVSTIKVKNGSLVDNGGGTVTLSTGLSVSNVLVESTADVVLDLAGFDTFHVYLLTNASVVLSNANALNKRAHVYYQQDTNGTRTVTHTLVGGLIQTNASLAVTTNANALDLLEVMPGFFSTNLLAWWPQNFQPRVAFTNSLAGDGGGPSYLVSENFEGTGVAAGWTDVGSPIDWDYTGVILTGSQSLRINDDFSYVLSPTFAATADCWFYFKFRPVSLSANAVIGVFVGPGAEIQLFSDGTVRLSSGVNTSSTVGTMSAGTTYHVWAHYVKGSGANATISVGFSTDGSRPTSGNNFTSRTDDTATQDVTAVQVKNSGGGTQDFIYDTVRVDDAVIGDNPP